jgi:hypothetical protein
VADLRTRFIEDYAGGLLNVARQELSSTGEVLAQDGFPAESTLFVEDGRGVKSGLRLGAGLAECIDPVTETGILNVRSADRTYAKVRDLKLFATAVASAQSALSQSVTEALTNLESAFDTLDSDVQAVETQSIRRIDEVDTEVRLLVREVGERVEGLDGRVAAIEQARIAEAQASRIIEIERATGPVNDDTAFDLDIDFPSYFGLLSIETDVPAWVTVYTDRTSRARDTRVGPGAGAGVIVDAVTSEGSFLTSYLPVAVGYTTDGNTLSVRVVNQSDFRNKVNVKLRYIRL